ncbi:MAG: tetratricopeptide repeat protein [Candidatus Latescibacteria bacterium]|nr:tetratricopeptide repeat protein [bacterium]MBD3423598.1 tetratricopeptide repeat protein [Candidatus Latescibacterota bacterium]
MKGKSQQKRLTAHQMAFLVIMLAAVVIRIIYITQLSGSELSGEISIDSEFYRQLAVDILEGSGIPGGALTFNPMYPFFLVMVFAIFGPSLLATRIIQSLLGIVIILLTYLAASNLARGHRDGKLPAGTVSLTAMALAVLYPQFMLYEGMMLGSTLEILLLTAAFNLALYVDRELQGGQPLRLGSRTVPVWLTGLMLGLICGTGALGRPNLFLLLIAAIPVWMIIRYRRISSWLRPTAGFALGAVLILLPPTIYNYSSSGKFVPVTAHGGINFYIGNRPGTHGVYQPPEDVRGEMRGLIADSRAKAEKETGREMTDAEASDYYMQKALDNIRNDPGGWLLLLGRKLVLFWNKVEVHDIPEVLYFQESLPIFSLPFLSFALIAPLGIAGFVIFLRGGNFRSALSVFLGAAHLSILLFYLNSRYRLPIVPLIIIMAAYFAGWLVREVRKKRYRPAGIMLAVAMTIFFLVSSRSIISANRGNVYTYLGTYYMNAGKEQEAARAFEKAYRLDPDRDTSMINYGRVLMLRGEYRRALEIFSRAYSVNPRYPRLAIMYAYTLQKLGRYREAARLARSSYSEGQPADRVTACKILATAAFFEKRPNEAMKWIRAGLKIDPDDRELLRMQRSIRSMPNSPSP